jgi:hypothetical protein
MTKVVSTRSDYAPQISSFLKTLAEAVVFIMDAAAWLPLAAKTLVLVSQKGNAEASLRQYRHFVRSQDQKPWLIGWMTSAPHAVGFRTPKADHEARLESEGNDINKGPIGLPGAELFLINRPCVL